MKLKVGDIILIRKPKNVDEHPSWVELHMDKYNGKVVKLTERMINDKYITINEWDFNEKWLIKI